jgi:hypothetical protein
MPSSIFASLLLHANVRYSTLPRCLNNWRAGRLRPAAILVDGRDARCSTAKLIALATAYIVPLIMHSYHAWVIPPP